MSQSEEGAQDNWSKLRSEVVSENVDSSLVEIPKKVMKLWRKNFAEGQRRGEGFETIFEKFNKELQADEIKYEPSKNHFEGLYNTLKAKKARFINKEIESLKGFVGEEMVKSLDQYLLEICPNTELTREILQQYMKSPNFRAQVGVKEGSFLKRHSSHNSYGHDQDAKSLPNTIDSVDKEFGIFEDERAKIEADFIKMVSTPDGVEQIIRKRYRRMVLMDATSGLGERFKEVDSELVARMDESISFPKNVDLSLASVRRSLGQAIKTVLSKDIELKEKIDALRKSMTEIEQKESAIASWKRMGVQFKEDFNQKHDLEDTDEARKKALEQCSEKANILLQNYKELMKVFTPEIMTKAIVESANFLAFKRDFVQGLKSCGVSLNLADHRDPNYMKSNRFLQDNSSRIKEFQAQGGTAEDLANMLTSISKKKVVSDKTWKKLADNLNQQVHNASSIFDKVFSELEAKKVKLSTQEKKLIQVKLADNIRGLAEAGEKGSNAPHITQMLATEIGDLKKRGEISEEIKLNYLNSRMTKSNLEMYSSGFHEVFSYLAGRKQADISLDKEKLYYEAFKNTMSQRDLSGVVDPAEQKALMGDFCHFVSNSNLLYKSTMTIPKDYHDQAIEAMKSSLLLHRAFEDAKSNLDVEITDEYKRIFQAELFPKVNALLHDSTINNRDIDIKKMLACEIEIAVREESKSSHSIENAPPLSIRHLMLKITQENLGEYKRLADTEFHSMQSYLKDSEVELAPEQQDFVFRSFSDQINKLSTGLDEDIKPDLYYHLVEFIAAVQNELKPDEFDEALRSADFAKDAHELLESAVEGTLEIIAEEKILAQSKVQDVDKYNPADDMPPLLEAINLNEANAQEFIELAIENLHIDPDTESQIIEKFENMVDAMRVNIDEDKLEALAEAFSDALLEQIDMNSPILFKDGIDERRIVSYIEEKIPELQGKYKQVEAQSLQSLDGIEEIDVDMEIAKGIILDSLEHSYEIDESKRSEISRELAPMAIDMQYLITKEKLIEGENINKFLVEAFDQALESQISALNSGESLDHPAIRQSIEGKISELREKSKSAPAQNVDFRSIDAPPTSVRASADSALGDDSRSVTPESELSATDNVPGTPDEGLGMEEQRGRSGTNAIDKGVLSQALDAVSDAKAEGYMHGAGQSAERPVPKPRPKKLVREAPVPTPRNGTKTVKRNISGAGGKKHQSPEIDV